MVESVLAARVDGAAVALFDAFAVHFVRRAASSVVGRLRLVVIKSGALRGLVLCAVKVARRDMVAAVRGAALVVFKLDKPPTVGRVVQLLPDRRVPVESLDRVAVDPHPRLLAGNPGVGSEHHLRLFCEQLFIVHRMGVGPESLGVRPVVHHEAVPHGLVHRVEPRVVARIEYRASRHVPRGRPRGQAHVALDRWWRRWRRPRAPSRRSWDPLAHRRVSPRDHVGAPGVLHDNWLWRVRRGDCFVADQVVDECAIPGRATGRVVRPAVQCEVESTSEGDHVRGHGKSAEAAAVLGGRVRRRILQALGICDRATR
mmetsp:Transcript_32032/g.83897  ORF Transcript_32032/g.83897 Transcript_32032/m.83897 type:complete len:314 (-) Transcript_32032:189-1130(-)